MRVFALTMGYFATFLLLSLSHIGMGESQQNLTFMMITSSGRFGFNSSGLVPAANMALEDINHHPDILPGYNLMYDKLRDSQVSVILINQCYNYIYIYI